MVEGGNHGCELLVCHSLLVQHVRHAVGDNSRLLLQGSPMFGQSYNRLTGIILALLAGHHLHRLHAFDEWRERVALQVEPMRDGIEGQTVLLPEHHQYQILRIVGNNYNQTIKELKCHFSERRAMALVCKLEKYMIQLVLIMHKVIEQTDEYQKKVQKSGEKNIKM